MNRYLLKTSTALALTVSGLFAVTSTHAAGTLQRAYVSSTGSDKHNCAEATPCRNLNVALAAVQSGGEIWILDSGNFNESSPSTVTITQSVTILAIPGAAASILAQGANAINITGSGITVTLRNLAVVNTSVSGVGVYVNGANTQLIVEGSEFSGLTEGISFVSSSGQVNVSHSVFRQNVFGIVVNAPPATQLAQGAVDHCIITGTGTGIRGYGVDGAYSNTVVSHSIVTNFAYGVVADTGSTITLNDDVIAQNNYGAWIADNFTGPTGNAQSTGNNTFQFNASGNVLGGTLTSVSQM